MAAEGLTSRPQASKQQPSTARSRPARVQPKPQPVWSSWPISRDALFFTSAANTSMPRNPSTAEKYNDKDIVQSHSQKSQ